MHSRSVQSILLVLCLAGALIPADTLACQASIANMILKGQVAEAAELFVEPPGAANAMTAERIRAELNQIVGLSKARGNPEPLTTQLTKGTSLRLDAGYKLRSFKDVKVWRIRYAVESPTVPGLIMNVMSIRDSRECSVFSVQLETFDPAGINALREVLK